MGERPQSNNDEAHFNPWSVPLELGRSLRPNWALHVTHDLYRVCGVHQA